MAAAESAPFAEFVNTPVSVSAAPVIVPVKIGLIENTADPVPVSSVRAAIRFAELGVARNVATPVPKPETPLEMGSPVALVRVAADGVPKSGVVSAGLVAKTSKPVPVSLLMIPASWADVVAPKIPRLLVTVPGNVKVVATESVGVVVEPSEMIWLAVPRTDVTVPEPLPVPSFWNVPAWH